MTTPAGSPPPADSSPPAGSTPPGPAGRLAAALIRSALRRWPAELRADLGREWLAELHALSGERFAAVAQLRFAVSLATSPAVEPAGGRAPLGARAVVLAPAALLLAPVAAHLLQPVAERLTEIVIGMAGLYAFDLSVPAMIVAALLCGYALARAGRWTGEHLPLTVATRLLTPVLVGAGTLAVVLASRHGSTPRMAAGALLWAVLLTCVCALRNRVGAMLAAGCVLAGAAVGLVGSYPAQAALRLVVLLLPPTAFVLTHLGRAGSVRPAPAVATVAAPVRRLQYARTLTAAGLLGVVTGIAAIILGGPRPSDYPRTYDDWLYEIRLLGVLLVLLGMVAGLLGIGLPRLPGVVRARVLVATAVVAAGVVPALLAHGRWHIITDPDPPVHATIISVGLVAVLTALATSSALAARTAPMTRARAAAAVAVTAVVCAAPVTVIGFDTDANEVLLIPQSIAHLLTLPLLAFVLRIARGPVTTRRASRWVRWPGWTFAALVWAGYGGDVGAGMTSLITASPAGPTGEVLTPGMVLVMLAAAVVIDIRGRTAATLPQARPAMVDSA